MVNADVVNAETRRVFVLNLRGFHAFSGRFLRFKNPVKYIRNINIYQETPTSGPLKRPPFRISFTEINALSTLTLPKGAFV